MTATGKMDIAQSIENLKKRYSDLERYANIMEKVRAVDVSSDADFQRVFTYFYKVRRNSEWRSVYYGLFERCKTNHDLSFSYILRTLYAETGRIESSFSSKLLATLKPDMPIWDQIVLSRLELKPSQAANKDRRIADNGEKYQNIVEWYYEFLYSSKAQDILSAFDRAFPEFKAISDVKKIDFILWGSGAKGKSK